MIDAPIARGARLTLVLGGARSGKSDHALLLAMAEPPPWVYIATAEAIDAEMEERIKRHKAVRGQNWRTVEAPLNLVEALKGMPDGAPVVIDCATLWLSNLMHARQNLEGAIAKLEEVLRARQGTTIVVSNEVGLGIVPETPLGRLFRDEAGRLNQRLALLADRVLFLVAGLVVPVKEPK